MKKILFPTDFSIPANHAFLYAMNLAKKLNAKISLLHVSGSLYIPFRGLARQNKLNQLKDEFHAKSNELLEGIPEELIAKTSIAFGPYIATEIADEAAEGSYDLIVMGMKGESKDLAKSIGSITTNLMIEATCPVLAISDKTTYEDFENMALVSISPYSTARKPVLV